MKIKKYINQINLLFIFLILLKKASASDGDMIGGIKVGFKNNLSNFIFDNKNDIYDYYYKKYNIIGYNGLLHVHVCDGIVLNLQASITFSYIYDLVTDENNYIYSLNPAKDAIHAYDNIYKNMISIGWNQSDLIYKKDLKSKDPIIRSPIDGVVLSKESYNRNLFVKCIYVGRISREDIRDGIDVIVGLIELPFSPTACSVILQLESEQKCQNRIGL